MRQLNQQIQMLVEESAARKRRRHGGSSSGHKKKMNNHDVLGEVANSLMANTDTPKGRGRGGPSPGGPPPSKRPKVSGTPAGRGAGGAGPKKGPAGPSSAAAAAAAGLPEPGYQSDEEDTAVPMSYDEKRQVGFFEIFILYFSQ